VEPDLVMNIYKSVNGRCTQYTETLQWQQLTVIARAATIVSFPDLHSFSLVAAPFSTVHSVTNQFTSLLGRYG
jgi:hypothetical protein